MGLGRGLRRGAEARPPPASSFMQKERVPLLTRCDCCQKTHSPFPEDSLQPGSSKPRERLPACLSVRECVHACVGVCWPAGLCEAMGRIKAIRILPEFPLLDRALPAAGSAACGIAARPAGILLLPAGPRLALCPSLLPPSLALT